jgi:hypothetical protein
LAFHRRGRVDGALGESLSSWGADTGSAGLNGDRTLNTLASSLEVGTRKGARLLAGAPMDAGLAIGGPTSGADGPRIGVSADEPGIIGGAGWLASSGSVRVTGSVVAGSTFPWAGVIFAPGPRPFAAANLRSKRALAFQARGHGGNYSVLVFTAAGGFMPSVQTFVAPKRWERHRLAFSEFGTDGRDISGIAFVATTPGAFRLEIDEVELTP